MEFEFVSDKVFQEILKRDFAEMKTCVGESANKAALVLAGSILEALLCDYLTENLPAGVTRLQVLDLGLNTLLNHAEIEAVITSKDRQMATALKDYRNLIHPGMEVRKKEIFDAKTAEVTVGILELLIKKIELKYKEKFSHSADEILFKLNEDANYYHVFGMIASKLSPKEKEKLMEYNTPQNLGNQNLISHTNRLDISPPFAR